MYNDSHAPTSQIADLLFIFLLPIWWLCDIQVCCHKYPSKHIFGLLGWIEECSGSTCFIWLLCMLLLDNGCHFLLSCFYDKSIRVISQRRALGCHDLCIIKQVSVGTWKYLGIKGENVYYR